MTRETVGIRAAESDRNYIGAASPEGARGAASQN